MKSNEIRTSFLEFFRSKEHSIVQSSPLIPWNDPSILFVNAGMVQFKRVFLGEEHASFQRAVSCQKCMRAGGKHSDLENVGHTARHHTFFEMLGNFSFGDYFKKEAILYSWELFIDFLSLPSEKLYVSVYEEDEEAARLWSELTGIPDTRIIRLGAKDNFWQMADTGPCGPCSEIIIDQGAELGCGRPECAVGCDCDRFLELWNLVFMQFDRDEKGTLTPLPKPSIDTGMGLERITAVLQGKTNNFDTDLFEPIIRHISSLCGIDYPSAQETDTSMRVIADHLRASVFMLSEGLVPSNEGRGYVLRRIIRRAARHAKLLNMSEPCLFRLAESVIDAMGGIYPEIIRERDRITKLLGIEEERFTRTIETGITILDDIIADLKGQKKDIIPGEEVFRLYDTYGFPLDFAKDIAMDAGLTVDEDRFREEMESQRQRSKGTQFISPQATASGDLYTHSDESEFVGYKLTSVESVVNSAFKDGMRVDHLKQGEKGVLVLDKTPFYAESGGQVGDTGTMESKNSFISVNDTRKPMNGVLIHDVKIEKGNIHIGDRVSCTVDKARRKSIMRNHTATHLLQQALKIVLGDHIKQSGSVVSPEKLRFDFTHFNSLSIQEIQSVEDIVNHRIWDNLPVTTQVMNIEDALGTGAVALFDEKYGDTVRVISVDEFSRELCGGTHCASTGEIGLFTVISEGSVASGIRRIEAVTGERAFLSLRKTKSDLDAIKDMLKTEEPSLKIEKLLNELKSSEKEIQRLKTGSSKDTIADAIKNAADFQGIKIVRIRQDGLNQNELRLLADNVRDRLGSGVIVIISATNGQASVVCMVTKDLLRTLNANNIIKGIANISGGRGGGKPDLAQGGTKNIDKLNEALDSLLDIIENTYQWEKAT